jgi:single-stranded DNA-binding protein
MTELIKTVGSIRVEGKVSGFDPSNENTYREGETKHHKPYRSVSIGVRTSPTNVVYNLDAFGQVPDKKVKIFSNKNGEKKSLEIDFKDRHDMPAGFTCFGFGTVGTGFDKKMKNLFSYDGAEAIKDNLENDTPVWVEGEFNVNTYQSNGETKTSVKYAINRIGLLKDGVDFESENFKEVASFEQEFVVVDHNYVKETNKLNVIARIINWDKSWDDITFTVDVGKYKSLAENIKKKTKFGDLLKVQGRIINAVELQEIEQPVEINWGGETPQGQGKKVIKNHISELQITNVLKHEAKKYREEDFVVAVSTTNEFDMSNNSSSYDPFADDGKPIDISDDDLPF